MSVAKLLLKAKPLVPHGEFREWCEKVTPFSYDRCKKFMHVAKRVQLDLFDPQAPVMAALKALSGGGERGRFRLNRVARLATIAA